MPDTKNEYGIQGEDEIDLYPYWLAIRRRWKMIFILVLMAVVGAGVATRYMSKVYRVNAIISLGRIETGDRIKPLATLDDINQMMLSGNLLKKIAGVCNLDETKIGPALEKGLSAEAKPNSEYVFLKYETAEPDQGVAILNALIAAIQNTYNPRTENYRRAKDSEINLLEGEIADIQFQQGKIELKNQQLKKAIEQKTTIANINKQTLEAQKASILAQIKNYEDRIQGLEETKSQLIQAAAVTESPKPADIEDKTKPSQVNNNESLITALWMANIQQQNIEAKNQSREKRWEYDLAISDGRKEIHQLKIDLATVEGQIGESALQTAAEIDELQATIQANELEIEKSIPAKIAKVKNGMQSVEIQKAMIEGIEVISEPDYFNIPIQPKRKMIVGIAAFAAFFVGICLAIASNQNKPVQKQS
jgi:hypothetical protein